MPERNRMPPFNLICGNIDACLYVRPSDRTTLERLVADGKTPQKIVARARIVLLSGRGFGTNSIQREARVSKPTVWRWQKAYMDGGVERLLKEPSPRDSFVRQNAVP